MISEHRVYIICEVVSSRLFLKNWIPSVETKWIKKFTSTGTSSTAPQRRNSLLRLCNSTDDKAQQAHTELIYYLYLQTFKCNISYLS